MNNIIKTIAIPMNNSIKKEIEKYFGKATAPVNRTPKISDVVEEFLHGNKKLVGKSFQEINSANVAAAKRQQQQQQRAPKR